MIDLRDVSNKSICVTGRIPGFTKTELEILLKARGATFVNSSPSKNTSVVVAAENEGKKVDKARALGLPLMFGEEVRAALGAPLEGYRARLEARMAARPKFYKTATAHLGEPAPGALLDRVAERVGFALPAAARNLFSQVNGISYLWATRSLPFAIDGAIPWSEAMHQDGRIWRALAELQRTGKSGLHMGHIAIPDVETIFFSQWDGRVFTSDNPGPKDKVAIGKKKAKAQDFWRNLFLFDAFHGYYQAALWADPVSEEFYVVYGSDYGADWGWSNPISLELYMEFLCCGFGDARIIEPASKAGMTTSMHRIAGQSWIELRPFDRL